MIKIAEKPKMVLLAEYTHYCVAKETNIELTNLSVVSEDSITHYTDITEEMWENGDFGIITGVIGDWEYGKDPDCTSPSEDGYLYSFEEYIVVREADEKDIETISRYDFIKDNIWRDEL